MDISLDTNIWIFGITGFDPACEVILAHLDSFSIIVLDQVRTELERNLSSAEMSRFYHLVIKNQVTIDLEAVPEELVRAFVQNGLKKVMRLLVHFASGVASTYLFQTIVIFFVALPLLILLR